LNCVWLTKIKLNFIKIKIGNCGRVNSRASKILNGKDALPHEFSWLVSIKTRSKDIKDGKGSHFCAGFIIGSRHLIDI
jgi:hypothetical protein